MSSARLASRPSDCVTTYLINSALSPPCDSHHSQMNWYDPGWHAPGNGCGSADGSGDGQIGHTSSSGIMRISSSSSGGGVGGGGVGGGGVGGGGDDATSGLSVSRS